MACKTLYSKVFRLQSLVEPTFHVLISRSDPNESVHGREKDRKQHEPHPNGYGSVDSYACLTLFFKSIGPRAPRGIIFVRTHKVDLFAHPLRGRLCVHGLLGA